ncbi:MAG TPA: baseplate J/gp47 family protein [Rummeliibacillus sp.]|nr:baseplate J/gp47 family protein [Rummeliibacillus sp.]
MARFNLPDFNFLTPNLEEIEKEMIFMIEEETGEKLTNNLPKRAFVKALVAYVAQQYYRVDNGLKQKLLSYAEDEPLDHIGEESETTRLDESYATTTMLLTLSSGRTSNFKIPAGTRVVVGENIFFATKEDITVTTEQNEINFVMQCTEPGSFANGYLPGEINTLVDVDNIPYAISIVNTTTTSGGADVEDNDNYAERIRTAPSKYSTAGPDDAYIYWAKSAHQAIQDVEVDSPTPGVTRLTILLQNGELPSEEILNLVKEVCSAKTVRPLTDNVIATAPETVSYDAEIAYYISSEKQAVATTIQADVQTAFNTYLVWQRSKMGRDVDLTELIARLKIAGAQRIVINSPLYAEVDKVKVAKENVTTLTFAGIADE